MPTYNSQSFITVVVVQDNLQASDAEQAHNISNDRLEEVYNKVNEVLNEENEYISNCYVNDVDELEQTYTSLRSLQKTQTSQNSYTSLTEHYNK
jgi:DNA repair ATPase RecN